MSGTKVFSAHGSHSYVVHSAVFDEHQSFKVDLHRHDEKHYHEARVLPNKTVRYYKPTKHNPDAYEDGYATDRFMRNICNKANFIPQEFASTIKRMEQETAAANTKRNEKQERHNAL